MDFHKHYSLILPISKVYCLYLFFVCVSHSVLSDSFATPWTVALQAPLSLGFSRQEYWSRLPFPSLGINPSQPRDQTQVSCIAGRFFSIWATKEALSLFWLIVSPLFSFPSGVFHSLGSYNCSLMVQSHMFLCSLYTLQAGSEIRLRFYLFCETTSCGIEEGIHRARTPSQAYLFWPCSAASPVDSELSV